MSLSSFDTSKLLQDALTSPAYDQVQRRLFRQLMEALIYEGLVPAECTELGGKNRYTFHSENSDGMKVRYEIQGKVAVSFDRIRLDEETVAKYTNGNTKAPLSILNFIDDMQSQLGSDQFHTNRLKQELELTLVNDSVAQFQRSDQVRLLRGEDYDMIETHLADGHPYHPCYKSRVGFTFEDNLAYAPEFAQTIHPVLLAAHKDIAETLHSRNVEPETFYGQELPAFATSRRREQAQRFGRLATDYLFVPVHPWQWDNVIARYYAGYFNTGSLLYLGVLEDGYLAQQSIRTLVNRSNPEHCYLKCAMSIQNTSSSRILSPHTVKNAPIVSDWLMQLYRNDPYLAEQLGLILLPEIVGTTVHLNGTDGSDVKYGALSCIWRESLIPHLKECETAFPFSAITSIDGDGRPIIDDWISDHSVETWVTAFLEVTIRPIIHLLYSHGVGVEAHSQNSILVCENGMPARLALKDFHDGIRYVPSLQKDADSRPKIHHVPSYHQNINRNSYIEIEDFEYVRDFVLDAVFFINLSEIAHFLEKHFDFPERSFWQCAYDVITDYQSSNTALADRYQELDMFVETVEVEQLAKRRLFPDDGSRSHHVKNPLWDVQARSL
ncbi:Siderophore synthetase component [Aliiroseovarius halocynthiae]|nr:IucA/IucC family protein [Aliiroseovarius halocynthiae]SMR71964.1 Siderophore synthetase component [Aliiroseovarius halocynthiae]